MVFWKLDKSVLETSTLPSKDPERRKAYNKWYHIAHRKHCQKKSEEWRKAHPEKAKKLAQRVGRNWRTRIKREVLSHYGPCGELRCCWPECGITDIDMLTLDHINDDGAKDRKERKKSGTYLYVELRKLNFPLGYQTLCANHNWKKECMRKTKKMEEGCGLTK